MFSQKISLSYCASYEQNSLAQSQNQLTTGYQTRLSLHTDVITRNNYGGMI